MLTGVPCWQGLPLRVLGHSLESVVNIGSIEYISTQSVWSGSPHNSFTWLAAIAEGLNVYWRQKGRIVSQLSSATAMPLTLSARYTLMRAALSVLESPRAFPLAWA